MLQFQKGLTGFQIFIVNLKSTDPNTMAQFLRQFFPETNDINPSPNGKGITFIEMKMIIQGY